jgi:secreted PhoX family phosphatase
MNERTGKLLRAEPPCSAVWQAILSRRYGRRAVLKRLFAWGAAAAALHLDLRAAWAAGATRGASGERAEPPAGLPFEPIRPTTADEVTLPRGYRHDLIAYWGQDIGGGESFGFNADFTAFFPIDHLEKGHDLAASYRGFTRADSSSSDGLLAVNHEYPDPLFVSYYDGEGPKTDAQLDAERRCVGMSIIRVRRGGDGAWRFDAADAAHNRRLDAMTPMVLTGPAKALDGGPLCLGTMGNCSGGMTPWGTALTCEENFHHYTTAAPDGYGWDTALYGRRHYGWVVEVDPFDRTGMPRKHTAMGRFRHENVALRVGADGTVVGYMGDDRIDSCIFKFVADRKLAPGAERAANLRILESGKLYAADFANGKWVLLDYHAETALRDAKATDGKPLFRSQGEVLADATAAALQLKATPVDRPEDLEVHPLDGSVYISLTNNANHGNFHGQIVHLVEKDGDPAALTFDWSLFAAGGPHSGFSSPDNLAFDGEGNLWMATDITTTGQRKGIYRFQGNNGLFFFRTAGPDAGVAHQFASGPVGCELAGPSWTPDGKTLFLSVQHPGEDTVDLEWITSHWPHGGESIPRPGVIAITGFPGRVV